MGKLIFKYGTMNSAKTLSLVSTVHSYTRGGKKTLVIKPSIDVRFGEDIIKSRAGISVRADMVVDSSTNILKAVREMVDSPSSVFVDEANFLDPLHVDQLREIASNIADVTCYGLRTDYKTRLFPASKRLMEIADSLEECSTVCDFCNSNALVSYRKCEKGGIVSPFDFDLVVDTPVDIGSEDKYGVACWKCLST